ncbi:cadmium resistance transporter [Leuconostoc fallax]|mgnify:FL=1|uniref:cadmium resistance transporter n=1 Tax=Leuconostoc fallax TaxID=1251 RepID=UPI0020917FEC|nr:cadmium resistance transporter [Leuconostoc fallax]MCO6183992.1 cadmium resistance transporter [Leuconostoc fallax]
MDLGLLTLLFFGVNIDFFILLLVLLQRYHFTSVWLGYSLGVLSSWIIGALLGQTLQLLIPTWFIGLLGLIPIWMGFHDTDSTDKDFKYKSGSLAVFSLYLSACGADNLAVYVPILSTMSLLATVLTAGYFMLLVFLSLIIADRFDKIKVVDHFLQKYGSLTTRIIYIMIGIFVIIESGLIRVIIHSIF